MSQTLRARRLGPTATKTAPMLAAQASRRLELGVVHERAEPDHLDAQAGVGRQLDREQLGFGLAPDVGAAAQVAGVDRRRLGDDAAVARHQHGDAADVDQVLRAGLDRRFDHVARRPDRVALVLGLAAGGLGGAVHDRGDARAHRRRERPRQIGGDVVDAGEPRRPGRHAPAEGADGVAGVAQLLDHGAAEEAGCRR